MALDLPTRLIDEGLLKADVLAAARAETALPVCIIARVVDRGVDGARILELLEEEFGLPVGPVALAGAPLALTLRLPARLAYTFHAVPVAVTPEFVIVAMSDPTNEHAVTEIGRAIGKDVLPRPAKVGDLRQALLRAYPDGPPAPEPRAPSEPAPLQLTRAKKPDVVQSAVYVVEPAPLELTPKPAKEPLKSVPDAAALPLSRAKAAPDDERPSRTFSKPIERADESTWSDLEERRKPAPRPAKVEIGPTLAAIRDAADRDDIVQAACVGALKCARTVVFLALRRGVLRGWEAQGDGISQAAVRNLWIPASSPSMFRAVLDERIVHRGSYGASAADHLYRAAIGSRGGTLEIHPITVRGTVVALLCADEPTSQSEEVLPNLAHAVGEALSRVVTG